MRCTSAWVVLLAVTSLPAVVHGQSVPERQLVERFRIGGIDAPEHAAFVREPDIAAAPDGTIFVRSVSPPVIDAFDPEGIHLRTIGREGEGPGEFRVALRHGLLGDTLWVLDNALLRVSTFLSDGRYLGTRRLEPIDLGMPLTAPHTISALLEGPFALAVPMAAPIGVDGRVQLPVLLGDRAFRESHTVLEVVRPQGMDIRGVGSFSLAPFPLPPLVSVAKNGNGFVEADWTDEGGGELIVTRYRPSGVIDWVRRLSQSVTPVPSQVRDSLLGVGQAMAEPYVNRARTRGEVGRASIRDLVSDGLHIPHYFPPALRILLGPDGSVWIRSGELAEAAEWLVLDPEGEPGFRVHLPQAFRVKEVMLETVWGTTTDEFDVPYVVRYDIR